MKGHWDAVANILDSEFVVSEFDLLLWYYVQFRINTVERDMKSRYGLNSATILLLKWLRN